MNLSQELIDLLREFEKDSPMKCVVVSSQSELEAAVEAHAKEGRRLAAVSNTGLSHPFKRLTFIPASAFRDSAPMVAEHGSDK